MENSIITWYSLKKTQKSQIPILHYFRIRFGMFFGIVSGTLGHDFRYFFVLDFRLLFWMYFSWRSAQKLSPNGSPNGPRISKKSKLVFSGSVWEDSTPIWLHFWSTLVAIWDVLGISWQPFGITFGHIWSLSGIFWSSSKDRLARCQVYSNTLNCPFCD